MAWTGRVLTERSACWCYWFYWSRYTRSAVQILCQMHDNSTHIQWEWIDRNKAAVTASYIANCIFKLSLERVKDLKGLRVYQLSSKNNYSLLSFLTDVAQICIVTIKSNQRKLPTTWTRDSVAKRQMPLRAEFAHPSPLG